MIAMQIRGWVVSRDTEDYQDTVLSSGIATNVSNFLLVDNPNDEESQLIGIARKFEIGQDAVIMEVSDSDVDADEQKVLDFIQDTFHLDDPTDFFAVEDY
jgi:predicted Mrr-cat superfamily restriction endonuclease